MKTDLVMRLAVWLVEDDEPGSAGEAFAGDLLETFASGRSPWWCFAQALQREAFSFKMRIRAMLLPLWYCIAFVFLHPLWLLWYTPSVTRLLSVNRTTPVWPGSALLEIAVGLLPAVLFVWIGIFIFLLLRWHTVLRMGLARILLSFSVGSCVMSVETMLRLRAMKPDLLMLSRTDFYYPVSHSRFSPLLFLGLFAAIGLLPRVRRLGDPNQHDKRSLVHRGLLRIVRIFGLMALLVPQASAQTVAPYGVAAKRVVHLVELFDTGDWNAFQAAYVAKSA